MMQQPTERVIQALAVTAELTNTLLSPAAARVLAADVAGYPEDQVLGALNRCRKELKGKLTVADIISRLDDGRPGAEEAWAYHVPKNEGVTVVWNDEITAAWGVALPLLDAGDEIQARMAFKERYTQEVQRARDAKKAPKWYASLGTDAWGREDVLMSAAERGLIPVSYVQAVLTRIEPKENPRLSALIARAAEKLLSGPK